MVLLVRVAASVASVAAYVAALVGVRGLAVAVDGLVVTAGGFRWLPVAARLGRRVLLAAHFYVSPAGFH